MPLQLDRWACIVNILLDESFKDCWRQSILLTNAEFKNHWGEADWQEMSMSCKIEETGRLLVRLAAQWASLFPKNHHGFSLRRTTTEQNNHHLKQNPF